MKYSLYIRLCLLLVASGACKKDKDPDGQQGIASFKVEKLSNQTVQAGMEVTVYGSGLVQKDLVTEVFVSSRPAEIVRQSPDSITVIVPEKTYSGKVMITISRGAQFSSAYGPDITVRPTPKIKGFYPVYAFGGQTIELYTENFSDENNNNLFKIDGQVMTIAGRKGKDTILITIPETASTADISYSTYGGPVYTSATPFQVRKKDYGVSTVADWLHKDPAFTYIDTLVRGYPILGGGNYEEFYKRTYMEAMQYFQSSDKKYTVFLPSDLSYSKAGITREAYIRGIESKPYNYNTMLISAVVPDQNIQMQHVTEEDVYNTAFTMLMQYYPAGTDDDPNYVKFLFLEDGKYAQLNGMYGETRPPVKVLNEIKVGNATIIEIDGELGYIYF